MLVIIMNSNDLTKEVFAKMYFAAFNKNAINLGIQKLSGGLKNRVYLMDDGKNRFVLKTVPSENKVVSEIDRNTLWWEADVLKKMEELDITTPRVLYYSEGIEEYHHPFMIMNYLEGNNYLDCKDNMCLEQKKDISFHIGEITQKICSIKKDYYYLPSFPNKKFKDNYEFVIFIFKKLLKIYKKYNINIDGITSNQVLELVKNKKKELNMVKQISMCNIDLWDGNILVKNGRISGMVDFTDTYYCDELMSFYFHLIDEDVDEYFLLGYGNKKLSYDEKVRIEIYRLYVVLKMIVDCEIKQYGRFGKTYRDFIRIYNKIITI